VKRLVTITIALLALAACAKKKEQGFAIQTAPVMRRDIVVEAEATGVVEPINVVEVKSKASGQITQMPVETGSLVRPGDLLVQLDTRDVKNQFDQADADVKAALAKLTVSTAQRNRSDTLFAQRIITATEHEAATLDYANATAQLVRARTSLDLAQQRLEDATVKAPVVGTIIEKDVSLGQVIASATGTLGGGTTLLKMADLNQVRVRALVNETDIGAVRSGQTATVTVDAYPDRPFHGTVEKIEPQAVVQQSVTMFPVLITLSNREGLLRPGMNGETAILTDRRDAVLSVPNDAIRSMREVAQAAALLGLNPDTVRRQLQAQFAMLGNGGPQGDAPRQVTISRGEVALTPEPAQQQGYQGYGQPLPDVTDKDCAAVKDAFAKHPDAEQQLRTLMDKVRSGELDRSAVRGESDKIYATVGVKADIARACRMKERAGGGAAGAGATGGRPDASAGAGGAARSGAKPGAATRQAGAGNGAAQAAPVRMRPGLVFISDSGKYAPRVVRLGVSNYDYTEVVGGLKEGDQVAILSAAAMQFQRQQQNDRFRGMTGGGVPGMQRTTPGAAGGAAGGAGGAGGGGGGRVRVP
jgi:HlyD family secretion protein